MGGIYVSGGSGLGKTTFVKLMERTYGLRSITEVIRSIHKNKPDVRDLEFSDRQFIYELEYFKLLHINTFSFLSDRSILDVFVWSGRSAEVVKYLGLETHPPDLIILLPTPSYEWYRTYIESFTRDMTRLNAYRDKFNLKNTNRLTEEEIATLIYGIERDFGKKMRQMCDYLDWPYFIPVVKRGEIENFQSIWQAEAEEAILQIWDVPRITLGKMPEQDKMIYEGYKGKLQAIKTAYELRELEDSLQADDVFDAGVVGEDDGVETAENTD